MSQTKRIGYGLLAGLTFLGVLVLLDHLVHGLQQPVTCGDPELGDQVFQVLAEARRILEESA